MRKYVGLFLLLSFAYSFATDVSHIFPDQVIFVGQYGLPETQLPQNIRVVGYIYNPNGDVSINDALNVSGTIYVQGAINAIGNQIYFGETTQTIGDYGTGIYFGDNQELKIETEGSEEGSLIVDGGVFVVNGSTNNVGIGTTSPSSKLHVVGQTRIENNAANIKLVGSDHVYQEFYPQGISAGRFAWIGFGSVGTEVLTIMNQRAANLNFGTNNAVRMSIDSAGNVGIGTSSPQAKLHVYGGNVIIGNDGGDRALRIYGFDGTNDEYIQIDMNLRTGNAEFQTSAGSDAGLIFSPQGTEAMRITASGDVGIGTTSPTKKLDVAGTGRYTSALTLEGHTDNADGSDRSSYWAYDSDVALVLRPLVDNGAVAILFPSYGNNPSDFAYIVYDEDYCEAGVSCGENGALILGAENDGSGSSDHVRVKSRLVVEADMSSSDPTAAFQVKASNTASDLFTVLRSGNVGIGTTSPAYKLDVTGTMRVIAGSGIAYRWQNTNEDDYFGVGMWNGTTDRLEWYYYNGTNSKWAAMTFCVNHDLSNPRLRIGGYCTGTSYNLYVGGTGYISNHLDIGGDLLVKGNDIKGNTGSGSLTFWTYQDFEFKRYSGGTGGDPHIGVWDETSSHYVRIWHSGSNPQIQTDTGDFQFNQPIQASSFKDKDDTGYYLDPSSTGTSLNVAGSIDVAGKAYLNGIALDNDADITGADQIVGYNDLRLYGDSSGGPDVYIASDGKVGIGTSSPSEKLHIVGGNLYIDYESGAALKVKGSIVLGYGSSYQRALLPSADNEDNIGASDRRFSDIYAVNVHTGDLHLVSEKGNWTIIEEEDALYAVNNKNGKRYKIVLEEVE